jgi:hypothetical protein
VPKKEEWACEIHKTFLIFVPLLAVPYDFSHKRQGIPTTKATIGKPLSMNNHSMTDTGI